jgi:hypothetical protein
MREWRHNSTFISALHGPATFSPGKEPHSSDWIRGWVGSSVELGSGNRTRAIQPVAIRLLSANCILKRPNRRTSSSDSVWESPLIYPREGTLEEFPVSNLPADGTKIREYVESSMGSNTCLPGGCCQTSQASHASASLCLSSWSYSRFCGERRLKTAFFRRASRMKCNRPAIILQQKPSNRPSSDRTEQECCRMCKNRHALFQCIPII